MPILRCLFLALSLPFKPFKVISSAKKRLLGGLFFIRHEDYSPLPPHRGTMPLSWDERQPAVQIHWTCCVWPWRDEGVCWFSKEERKLHTLIHWAYRYLVDYTLQCPLSETELVGSNSLEPKLFSISLLCAHKVLTFRQAVGVKAVRFFEKKKSFGQAVFDGPLSMCSCCDSDSSYHPLPPPHPLHPSPSVN